jgi:hypothetical protein
MEVGIFDGGSTAFMAQLARPRKLVAVDISSARSGLTEFVDEQGLAGSVAPHWEIDQSDGARLREIAATEFDAPIDLVVDDASHLLEPTRATFDALFPLLRPGGEYVIEDWAWAHAPVSIWPNRPPTTLLVLELVIACAHDPGLIAGVEVDRAWTVIRRGDGAIDPRGFKLAELLGDRGRAMIEGAARSNSSGERRRGVRRRG